MISLHFKVNGIRDEERAHQPGVFSSFVNCLVCKNYPKEAYSISSPRNKNSLHSQFHLVPKDL